MLSVIISTISTVYTVFKKSSSGNKYVLLLMTCKIIEVTQEYFIDQLCSDVPVISVPLLVPAAKKVISFRHQFFLPGALEHLRAQLST